MDPGKILFGRRIRRPFVVASLHVDYGAGGVRSTARHPQFLSVNEHDEILEALCREDSVEEGRLTKQHVESVAEAVVDFIRCHVESEAN